MMGADFPTALTNCAPTWTITCERGANPPFLQWPETGFEDEQAYDPATNMIYALAIPIPGESGYFGLNGSTYFTSTGDGGVPCPNCGILYDNATVYAINGATGALAWNREAATLQGFRGQIDVSGNLVYVTLSSGDIVMIDATHGNIVRDYYVGAPMDVGVTIGAALNGQEYVLVPVGTCSLFAVATCPGTTPGDVLALSLTGVPPPSTSTTTVISTTTSVTTAAGSVSISVSTTTVVSSSNSTALYGVAAVAVIFIIVSGYLAMRGRKPAS